MAEKLPEDHTEKEIPDVYQIDPSDQELTGKSAQYGIDYRFLADHMADIIWTMDLNLKTRYASPSIEKILGFTSQERKTQSLEEMITPGSIQSTLQLFSEEIQREAQGAVDPKRSVNIEVEYYKKDGSTIWMENHLKAIRDAEGKMIGILGVSRDISNRKKHENQLVASKKEWEDIFNAIGQPAMILDADHRIITANQTTFLKTGFSEKQLIGKACYEVFHRTKKPPESCPLEAIRRHGYLETVEMEMEAINETYLVSCTPITDNDGQVLKYIHIATDITEKKKIEEELLQTKKAEALGTLAGGIAHEFNNILGVIMGNAELAMDDVPDQNQAKDFLKEIREATLRAKEVVSQILSFSHKAPTTRIPVRIASIIQESLKLMQSMMPTTVDIRQEILCDREMVLLNPADISQILMNLYSNAIHAMQEDTGKMIIRLEPVILGDQSLLQYKELKKGAYVKLTVNDSGKGIDPEIMDRICDPYFTTKDVDTGLGMGLAVVCGIVKQHDGAIRFETQPDKGTSVEVLLPVTSGCTEENAQATVDLPRGSEQILIVDDEASLAKMLKLMLERQGYKVVEKTSSREALRLFQEKPDQYDLIITDMAMPEMSGEELSNEIIKSHPDMPIILCTGYSKRFNEKEAKSLGISAYAMKPYMKKDLLQTVRKVLDNAKNMKL